MKCQKPIFWKKIEKNSVCHLLIFARRMVKVKIHVLTSNRGLNPTLAFFSLDPKVVLFSMIGPTVETVGPPKPVSAVLSPLLLALFAVKELKVRSFNTS